MLSILIPSYGGGPNIERTIESCRPYCDDVVIISTALFDSDKEHFKTLGTVVELPWNYVFLHGHGSLYNQGTAAAKNDWLLLLGTAETVAETYGNLHARIKRATPKTVFRCDHVNDSNTWKRIWNRNGGTLWSGIIHEEIAFGHDGGLAFRMQDTDKTPRPDEFENEAMRYLKGIAYNFCYAQLLAYPERLGATNSGWLNFVRGSREAIEVFIEDHADMVEACTSGDLPRFLDGVRKRLEEKQAAMGVNFNPQGTPRSGNETITA